MILTLRAVQRGLPRPVPPFRNCRRACGQKPNLQATVHWPACGAQAGRHEVCLPSRPPGSTVRKDTRSCQHTRRAGSYTLGYTMCSRWPEPNSVLVMDNASFHQGVSIKELCQEAGVMLLFSSPYSPDLKPIEELFSQLKAFVRRHWRKYIKCRRASRDCRSGPPQTSHDIPVAISGDRCGTIPLFLAALPLP